MTAAVSSAQLLSHNTNYASRRHSTCPTHSLSLSRCSFCIRNLTSELPIRSDTRRFRASRNCLPCPIEGSNRQQAGPDEIERQSAFTRVSISACACFRYHGPAIPSPMLSGIVARHAFQGRHVRRLSRGFLSARGSGKYRPATCFPFDSNVQRERII